MKLANTIVVCGLAALSLGPVLAAQTFLIDYDDGISDNGIHDASIRNGGFEDADGTNFASTPFWESYFVEAEENDPVLSSSPHTGNFRSFCSGWQGTGVRTHPSQTIAAGEWTIQEGDIFVVSLWARAEIPEWPGYEWVAFRSFAPASATGLRFVRVRSAFP